MEILTFQTYQRSSDESAFCIIQCDLHPINKRTFFESALGFRYGNSRRAWISAKYGRDDVYSNAFRGCVESRRKKKKEKKFRWQPTCRQSLREQITSNPKLHTNSGCRPQFVHSKVFAVGIYQQDEYNVLFIVNHGRDSLVASCISAISVRPAVLTKSVHSFLLFLPESEYA